MAVDTLFRVSRQLFVLWLFVKPSNWVLHVLEDAKVVLRKTIENEYGTAVQKALPGLKQHEYDTIVASIFGSGRLVAKGQAIVRAIRGRR